MIYTTKPKNFIKDMSVATCYIVCKDKFLILQRQPNKSHGGTWGLPAGKISPKEIIQDAVVREVYEETGIMINTINIYKLKTLFVKNGNHSIQCNNHLYKMPTLPEVRLSKDEHRDYKWVNSQEALRYNLIHDFAEFNTIFSDQLP